MLFAQLFTGFYIAKLFSWLSGGVVFGVVGLVTGYMVGKGLNPISWVAAAFTKKD